MIQIRKTWQKQLTVCNTAAGLLHTHLTYGTGLMFVCINNLPQLKEVAP